jgi:antitoxin component of RelBE/YafQ-DinJ toxin-antitoxin module
MRKLNASLTFRLDAEQKALLVAEAKESGLSVSELTRSWLSDQVQLAKALPSIAEEVGEMMRMVDANRAIVARYRNESRGELSSSIHGSQLEEEAKEQCDGDRDDAKRGPRSRH